MHTLRAFVRTLARALIRRRALMVAVLAVAVVAFVATAHPAFAQELKWPFDALSRFLSQILLALDGFLAKVLVAVINIMVAVAQYNDFTHAEAVRVGWAITRDIANMFFIVILLVIAFGTIFNLDQYRYNRVLGRLILMAFLVNFSKLIAGFFIDIGQVIMLTFVNAFRDAAAGNLTSMFGLKELVALVTDDKMSGTAVLFEVHNALILAGVMLLCAIVVVGVITVMFIYRIIVLWFLVILAPLSFLLRTFPTWEQYGRKWWDYFGRYITIGPVLAFFLWLSLAIVSGQGSGKPTMGGEAITSRVTIESELPGGSLIVNTGSWAGSTAATTISQVSTSQNLLSFGVAIGLLIGAIKIASSWGVAGGSLAGKASDRLGGLTKGALRYATGQGAVVWAARKAGGYGVALTGKAGGRFGEAVRSPVQSALARIGGSSVPILNRLATGGYMRMQKAEAEAKEDADKYVSRISDTRILRRLVNQSPITARDRAIRTSARKRAPSQIKDLGERDAAIQALERADIQKLSAGELSALQKDWDSRHPTGNKLQDVGSFDDFIFRGGGRQEQRDAILTGALPSTYPMSGGTRVRGTKYMSDEEGAAERLAEHNLQFQQTKAKVAARGEEAFYDSQEYNLNRGQYVPRQLYQQLLAEEQRREQAGKTGVTLGSYGAGGRLMAANFGELLRAGVRNLDVKAGGLNVSGDAARDVARSLSSMIGQHSEKLQSAQTPDAMREALGKLGYSGDYRDEQLAPLKAQALQDAAAAQARLSDGDRVAREGVNLVNKGYKEFQGEPVSGLAVAKHEVRGHERWDAVDPDQRVRQAVVETFTPEQRAKLTGKNLEEKVANAEAGMSGPEVQRTVRTVRERVERPEAAQPPEIGEPQSEAGKRLEREIAAVQRVQTAPELREVQALATAPKERAALTQAAAGNPDFKQALDQFRRIVGQARPTPGSPAVDLFAPVQFNELRRLLTHIDTNIAGMGKQARVSLGALDKKIASLNATLPAELPQGAEPTVIKAVLEEQNVSEDDVKRLLQEISG